MGYPIKLETEAAVVINITPSVVCTATRLQELLAVSLQHTRGLAAVAEPGSTWDQLIQDTLLKDSYRSPLTTGGLAGTLSLIQRQTQTYAGQAEVSSERLRDQGRLF